MIKASNTKAVKPSTFRTYYQLTKPGIIYGNLITTTAGFLLAAKGHILFSLLLQTLLGIALVIASACVFNNYIDRDIDKFMSRTRSRALVKQSLPVRTALIYASWLGVAGFFTLGVFTNRLVVLAGLVGYVDYILFYSWFKRRSVHGTLVGSISGATPPVAGYLAVTNHLDAAALILFLTMVCWQMAHFYAIAIRRLGDYSAAKIPVLPVKKGIENAKLQIIFYVIGFTVAAVSLTFFGYTGVVYLIVVLFLGLSWLWRGFKGFRPKVDNTEWAKKMFLYSLVVTLALSLVLSISHWLP